MTDLISAKYTFVCDPDECDTLIELTTSDGFGFPSGVTQLTCPCNRQMSYLGCTILPTTTTKEDKMETDTTVSPAVDYNPDQLVTYKVIRGYSDTEYATDKVRNIEWELHNARQNSKVALQFQNKIHSAEAIILNAYEDSDDQETLRAIAEALEIELTKEVQFTATIEVTGTISYNVLEDFDLESEISDIYAESSNGNIEINEQYVTNIRED